MNAKFAGCTLNKENILLPTKMAKYEFMRLKEIYLSKNFDTDEIKIFEHKLAHAKGALFLDGSTIMDKIQLSSFLRSGNTLLRNYLE